jgi:hypothetical protein
VLLVQLGVNTRTEIELFYSGSNSISISAGIH